MKNILLLMLFGLCSMPALASHVVGGDISVQWVSANEYIIKVQVYRDDVSGQLDMPASLVVGVYQIGTNVEALELTMPFSTSSMVALVDDCYEPDPNVVRIEEGIYISAVVTLPNFSAGYYLQSQQFSRNDLIIDLLIPDAYLCVATPNVIDNSVTDGDGDSLVYS